MSEKKVLESNIKSPGTFFEVIEPTKDTTFGPGTRGIISYLHGFDRDYRNVAYIRFITLRRGKTGKDRIELNEITTPIFFTEDKDMSSILPDMERKSYVLIEPVPFTVNSIDSFERMEFIGWATAYATFLKRLHSWVNHNVWPKEKNHVLNRLCSLPEYFAEDPDSAIDYWTPTEMRHAVVQQIRKMECTMSRLMMRYFKRMYDVEMSAIKTVMDAKLGIQKDILANTLEEINNSANTNLMAKKKRDKIIHDKVNQN